MFKRKDDVYNIQPIESSISDAKPTSNVPFAIGATIHDIPAESIDKLKQSLNQTVRYAFYSFAVQAQDYIQQTDYLDALLYSVIAFENAHAEFIEHIADKRANRTTARRWAQELLREAGISTFISPTPALFMTSEDRPSDTTISGVRRAIKIRNEIAHAKRDKSGNLKIGAHGSHDLLPLIKDVLDYINVIARQLPN